MVPALQLPDELWVEIFDFLDAKELISLQRVSRRLFKLSRDTSLWRSKCFEEASTVSARPHQQINSFWSSLDRLVPRRTDGRNSSTATERLTRDSKRAKAIADWDCTHPTERIDWYCEYVARHAPLFTEWSSHDRDNEIRSIALFDQDRRILSATENGSLRIYDIDRASNGYRRIREAARSKDSLLFTEWSCTDTASKSAERMVGSAVDSTVVDSNTMRAYVAVDDVLNEIDLPTMKLVSRTKYPWRISAISQQTQNPYPVPLMVGTSYSLEMHDPRLRHDVRQSAGELEGMPQLSQPGERVVIFPNYDHESTGGDPAQLPSAGSGLLAPTGSRLSDHSRSLGGSEEHGIGRAPMTSLLGSWGIRGASPATTRMSRLPFSNHNTYAHTTNSRDRNEIVRPPTLESWLAARLEPGPQAILHRGPHEVVIAGRMPSILFYDTRKFPQLSRVLHSGARLSSLTTIPCPPYAIHKDSLAEATLVAGGEYHGRGSLELYELASSERSIDIPSLADRTGTEGSSSTGPGLSQSLPPTSPLHASDNGSTLPSAADAADEPCSYKNRQSSSSAKLLSVATQGTRIVFSDSEGALKWVERDGRSLVRRWNVNSYEYKNAGASLAGDRVARKIVTFAQDDSADDGGKRGDGDLLVWTGADFGIVTTRIEWESHQDMVEETESKVVSTGKQSEEEKAEEYARMMRKALERQADERRWMSRFGGRWR